MLISFGGSRSAADRSRSNRDVQDQTKNPRVQDSGIPFSTPCCRAPCPRGADIFLVPWAGLLTSGSPYLPPFPSPGDSGAAAFVPGYSGGSATDLHRFPLTPLERSTPNEFEDNVTVASHKVNTEFRAACVQAGRGMRRTKIVRDTKDTAGSGRLA